MNPLHLSLDDLVQPLRNFQRRPPQDAEVRHDALPVAEENVVEEPIFAK